MTKALFLFYWTCQCFQLLLFCRCLWYFGCQNFLLYLCMQQWFDVAIVSHYLILYQKLNMRSIFVIDQLNYIYSFRVISTPLIHSSFEQYLFYFCQFLLKLHQFTLALVQYGKSARFDVIYVQAFNMFYLLRKRKQLDNVGSK